MSKFPRRIVLRGFGGLAVALPLLEFTSTRAHAQAAPLKRFVTFFEHGGTLSNHSAGVYGYSGFTDGSNEAQGMDAWRPKSTPGQPLVLGDIHKPLTDAGLTNDVVVVRGIDNVAAVRQGQYGSNHGIANVTILTAAKRASGTTDENSVGGGPSIDQAIAQKWGAPSGGVATVNLYIDAHNYGSPYYRASNQPASRFGSPQDAFNSLFANVRFDPGAGPDPAVIRAQLLRRSVLDGTSKELARYKNQLTTQDKALVEAHLEHVRSIEQRLATQASQPPPATCSKPVLAAYNSIPTLAPLMVDIGLAALRCGVTRVLNIEIGDFHMTWDPTPLPFEVGYDIGHSLHHMARDLGVKGTLDHSWLVPFQQAMIRNRQFRAQMVARLLKGLKDTPDGSTGNLLDSSLFLWTSEFSTGAWHSGTDMPILLAGKAGGSMTPGRYLNYNKSAAANDLTMQYNSESTNNNLFISLLNKMGFADTTFGDMSYAKVPGPLAGL